MLAVCRTNLVLAFAIATLLSGCAEEQMYRAPAIVAPVAVDQAIKPKGLFIAKFAEEREPQILAESPIRQASAQSPTLQGVDKETTAEAKTLTPARLIEIVLERNPTLDQLRATAAAVQARYPQVTSLDDPMLGFITAPNSAVSNDASYAARTEITQKFPYFGKRGLRGQVVQAEANAACRDVDDMKLQLIESVLNSYADYYLTEKASVVNADNLKILQGFRKNAETRYQNGQVPQQDLLQADVEIGRQQERTFSLQRAGRVAKARLNTLMHLPPDAPLPPPDLTALATATPEAVELRARAVASRPDLKALANRIVGEEAAVALAVREYKPDVELLGAYDSFWQGQGGPPLRWQIGAKINMPVRLARRDAAVAEAQARVVQRRAELTRLIDQVNLQVQEAFELLRESEKVMQLYEKTLLPAAESNIKEAQTSYVNGKVPFVTLIEAQRSLITLKDRYNEALAEAVRRRAALKRAVGESVAP